MLATKTRDVFDDKDYIFEVKWDGYRIMASCAKSKVDLRTRKGLNYTDVYSSVTESLKKIPYSVVLDGEVIMLDEEGKPSFDLLQNVRTLGTEKLLYCVFDILWCEGYDLTQIPLMDRKKVLAEVLAGVKGHVANPGYIETKGKKLFKEMLDKGMEGIVAKEKNSIYSPGTRTESWLKMQTKKRQEFVIGGWTESDSGRPFRSLLFGYYDKKGGLICFGHAGGGYTNKSAAALMNKLKKLQQKKKTFSNEVDADTTVHWVKPVLVGEFEYATVTKSGKIRKPAIFKGLRTDKDPKDVHLDSPVSISKRSTSVRSHTSSEVSNKESNWPVVKEKLQEGSKNTLEIEGQKIQINNIEREYWHGITKGDLLNYYISVSDYILPYLKDRPLSLHIKHEGVFKTGLYIKGMEGNAPEFAETYVTKRKHRAANRSQKIDYLLCQNSATLLYVINLGCIDINPWNSTTAHPEHPTYLVIDLDPSGDSFEPVIKTAQVAHEVLIELGIISFPKTSGKTGIHIFIPVSPVFTFPQARSVVGLLARLINERIPDITTTEDLIEKRGDKVFIDDNKNDLADTLASAYSVRPAHTPTVSAPLDWKEVKTGLDPGKFTIKNMKARITKKGDLFKEILNPRIQKKNTSIIKNILSTLPDLLG